MKTYLKILLVLFTNVAFGQNMIVTVTGSQKPGFSGDGGLAINAQIDKPDQFTFDKEGNMYFGDVDNARIRKISKKTGIITTIAGNGTWGFSGDGGPATAAEMRFPDAFAIDKKGNLYFGDAYNYRVRRIDPDGIITTICGNGNDTFNGDNIPATAAQISGVIGMCITEANELYFADYYQHRVRKINLNTGIITTIAGTGLQGFSGDGLPATDASVDPADVALDNSGNIYIADEWNHRIRRIDKSSGIISSIVGDGTPSSTGDGGPASFATTVLPRGIFIDKNQDIFYAEETGGKIRKIDGRTGIISTVAGNGTYGYSGDGGPPQNAQITCTDVWVDDDGIIYITDAHWSKMRKVISPQTTKQILACLYDTVYLLPNSPNGYWEFPENTDKSIIDTTFGLFMANTAGTYALSHVDSTFTEHWEINAIGPAKVKNTITLNSDSISSDGAISITYIEGIGPYTFLWSTGDTLEDIEYLKSGTYWVEIIDKGTNCVSSDTFFVGVDVLNTPDSTLGIYNVITPNGDGANDFWIISGLSQFPTNEIEIFNKWGNVVFKTSHYHNNWNGYSNEGTPLPDGVYYYLVKINTSDGIRAYSGTLLIKR